jgi:hypothetical protein
VWAEKKGLRLDDNGALLYPKEEGPYEPRIRPKAGGKEEAEEERVPETPAIDLMNVPAEELEQTSLF